MARLYNILLLIGFALCEETSGQKGNANESVFVHSNRSHMELHVMLSVAALLRLSPR